MCLAVLGCAFMYDALHWNEAAMNLAMTPIPKVNLVGPCTAGMQAEGTIRRPGS